jgi:DNA-binding XRE family transcriptional regulator
MGLINQVSDKRKHKNMTQAELAEHVGVSRQTIIAIEKGNYVPSLELGLKICKVFNVSIDELFQLSHE